MNKTAAEENLRHLIQQQGEGLLDFVALIASGKTDIEIEIPEGIEVMSDLAVALQYLAEDVAERIRTQNNLLNDLENRVQERTKELETTLENLQRSQQQFVREEWSRYLQAQADSQENEEWLKADHFEPAIQEVVQNNAVSVTPSNGNSTPAITLPINYADELIGLLGFEGDDLENITDEDLVALEDIAEQVGLALENQRLFDQTQMALTETEVLYQMTALLNTAETPKDILNAITTPLASDNPSAARLWLVSTDENGSRWMDLAHGWAADEDATVPAAGFRIPLSTFKFTEELLTHSREIALISSIPDDPRTKDDPEFVAVTTDIGLKSMAFLPLTIGNRLIGLFNIGWKDVRVFHESDVQRFTAIASQIATSIDSLRLFEETRLRAEQLETLAVIETALSSASNEDEILMAIAQGFPNSRIALHYIDTDEADTPLKFQTVSSFENNQLLAPEYLRTVMDMKHFPAAEIWLQRPNQFTSIPNIFEDERTSDWTKKFTKDMGYTGTAFLPLRSARVWQGILTIAWTEVHTLTSMESFLLEQLREPVGAIVASNRAKVAEQLARQESEQLYSISRSLNEASGRLDDIVDIVADLGVQAGTKQIVLTTALQDPTVGLTGLEVAAIYGEDAIDNSIFVGQQFGRASIEQLSTFKEPMFIPDFKEMSGLTLGTKRLMEKFKVSSAGILPLQAGDQDIGYIFMLSDDRLDFSTESQRLLNSLTPQIAVAVQNSQLFAAAQRKAEREELLRQISEKVRNTSDVESVMRIAVTEIGRVLNRKTFVYLKDPSEDTGIHPTSNNINPTK